MMVIVVKEIKSEICLITPRETLDQNEMYVDASSLGLITGMNFSLSSTFILISLLI